MDKVVASLAAARAMGDAVESVADRGNSMSAAGSATTGPAFGIAGATSTHPPSVATQASSSTSIRNRNSLRRDTATDR